ncbi:MAG: Gfo/Idh/MocA family oxidoreductase [Spirochaeta sp.]|jgi:1,5-anhydro-D-fructose reductase (1,5-anhydro-D-mannitol-forming)|nr:Gfo/Idh/MocA family oxidoreductase [Spirochaeta sp.]
MATTAADCDAMIEVSAETGVPLWVAYYRRGLEKFVAIKTAMESGVIGEPHSIVLELSQDRARYAAPDGNEPWRVNPETAGAGIIFDMGSHMLDLVDWLFGPISVESSVAVNRAGDYQAEDVVSASFIAGTATTGRFVTGAALWDFSGRRETDRTIIRGSEGAIEYSTFDDAPALLAKDGTTTEMAAHPYPPHVHQPLVELINAELRGGAKSPSTATSGARTNRVLEALVGGYYAAQR